MTTRDRWAPGAAAWFEYHCFESDASADADLWHRSHRQVTVLRHHDLASHEPCLADELPTLAARADEGCPCLYRVRFADGVEHDVFEDELFTERTDFFRPDPPAVLDGPGR